MGKESDKFDRVNSPDKPEGFSPHSLLTTKSVIRQ